MAESSSFQSSSSSSTPSILETPENSIIDQISGVASNLANQMYSWANGVFAQTSAVTNQAVGNFFNVSQKMLGLSGNLTDQYNNLFAPENAQLVADANSYASPARMAVDMGQAGATQAQAGDQGLKNSEEALRSYGIDPSSGRYAALDKAAAVQNAANVAGAENTQRNADIATGQRLRSEAVQVGAQLPAAIANVNNTAIQANTGASNASLANANTGANLMKLPNDYLSTAMGVKLPPVGQNSQSSGSGHGGSSSPSPGSNGGGNQGNGPGNKRDGAEQPAWGMDNKNYGAPAAFQTNGNALGGNYDLSNVYGPLQGLDVNSFNGNNSYNPVDGYNMDIGQPGANTPVDYTSGDYQNPFQDSGFGQTLPQDQFGGQDQTYNGLDGGANTQYGNINYDSSANNYDPGWGQTYDQPSADTNWGNGADQYTGGSSDAFSGGDNSAFQDYGMSSGGDSSFAGGGAIPANMSPSHGRQVDDIPARGPGGRQLRMNANEFVIPQDVALWKGQEFFQKLIDQSRKSRVMAPAKPTQGPPGAMPRPQPQPMMG